MTLTNIPPRRRYLLWVAPLLGCIALYFVFSLSSAWADATTQPAPKNVTARDANDGGADPYVATRNPVGNSTVIAVTFKPKGRWKFVKAGDAWAVVENAPSGITPVITTQPATVPKDGSPTSITVQITLLNTDAANYKALIHGNLAPAVPGFGAGGIAQAWHWKANEIIVKGIVLNGRPKDNYPAAQEEGQNRFLMQDDELILFRADLDPYSDEVAAALQADGGTRFKWTLGEIKGVATKDIIPKPDYGDTVHAQGPGKKNTNNLAAGYIQFHISKLPPTNEGFGPNKLTLELFFAKSPDPATFRLFFDRFKTSHPKANGDPVTPNWYYYWSKEGNPGVCQFSRTPGNAAYATYGGGDKATGPYGAYGADGKIYIYNHAANKDSWTYTFPESPDTSTANWVQFNIKTTNAVQFVNATYAHEATHKLLHVPHGLDADKDGVPDAWEASIPGMDILNQNSFGTHFSISHGDGLAPDQEFYCVLGGGFRFGAVKAGRAGLAQNHYRGIVPSNPTSKNDWSLLSDHWNEDQ